MYFLGVLRILVGLITITELYKLFTVKSMLAMFVSNEFQMHNLINFGLIMPVLPHAQDKNW